MICKFCRTVNDLLSSEKLMKIPIYHCTSMIPAKRANAAFLMGAYQVLVMGRLPEESWQAFSSLPCFLPFRDASPEGSSFELHIIDCLRTLAKAKNLNWVNASTFDCDAYDINNQISSGSFNWIVPDKLIAFSNPISKSGQPGLTPEQYVKVFNPIKVTAIVRLSNATYDSTKFKKNGIRHYELFYPDGSIPDESIIQRFFDICRTEDIIAVHCQAGLGRTATLIGCYAIKNYGFTGPEYIAWARMCRTGSVLGPQQHFLCEYSQYINKNIDAKIPAMTTYELYKAECGDLEQGERLSSQFGHKPSNSLSTHTEKSLAKYKTKFNQRVNIDPVLLNTYKFVRTRSSNTEEIDNLYGKKNK